MKADTTTPWVTISPLNDKPEDPGQIEFHLTDEERKYARGAMAVAKARIQQRNRDEEAKLLAKALEEMGDEA